MTPETPYQVLPPLTDEEYSALRADIEEHGVLVAVEVDEEGNILDGHNRAGIARDLGIEYPTVVRVGLSEAQKREHAYRLNLARRHLTRAQVRDLIAAELERDDSRSDREISRLIGCDHKTVGAVRRVGKFPTAVRLTRELLDLSLDLLPVVREMHALRVWDVLGYESWEDYLSGEFARTPAEADFLRGLTAMMEIVDNWEAGRRVGRLHPGLSVEQYLRRRFVEAVS